MDKGSTGGFTMVKDHISIELDAVDLDQSQSRCKIDEKYRIAKFKVDK